MKDTVYDYDVVNDYWRNTLRDLEELQELTQKCMEKWAAASGKEGEQPPRPTVIYTIVGLLTNMQQAVNAAAEAANNGIRHNEDYAEKLSALNVDRNFD